jgi:glycosyltransferase involved in cell wall biosynthesis
MESTVELSTVELSVIVPVTDRYDPVREVYQEYKQGIQASQLKSEVTYVLDGPFPEVFMELMRLREEGEKIRIIRLAKRFGEATALTVGFNHSTGNILLTLPAYQQVQGNEIPKLVAALNEHDMVLARRWPRTDSQLNRIRSRMFNMLLKFDRDLAIHDAGCNVRVFKRSVAEEIHIYGDLHTFLPLMAHRHGFKVTELSVAQSPRDRRRRSYRTASYINKLLDILTIFFLTKFTKKPLRFFGLVGATTLALGLVSTLYVVAERLFFGMPLANRPALLLSSLLVVLGIQIFAIGLIGEIVIFTHARDLREYTVEKIIN